MQRQNKKRYTIKLLARLIIGISITLLYFNNVQKTNQIELMEKQIELLNDSNADLINRLEMLESTLEYINEQNAQ